MPEGPEAPQRELILEPSFLDDLRYWATAQPRLVPRILDLVEATRRDPFGGAGKPEPLKHAETGHWSRRVTDEHRLVYRVEHTRLVLVSARGHYR